MAIEEIGYDSLEEEIRKQYHQERDQEIRQALLSIWLKLQGFKTIEIARFLHQRTSTIRHWLDQWEASEEQIVPPSPPPHRSLFPTHQRQRAPLVRSAANQVYAANSQEIDEMPSSQAGQTMNTPGARTKVSLLAKICRKQPQQYPLLSKVGANQDVPDQRLEILSWICGWNGHLPDIAEQT